MIFLLLLLSQAQIETKLSPEYERKKITVGDPFELVLKVTSDQNTKIFEPFVDSGAPFTVLSQTGKVTQGKGLVTVTYRIKLAAFKTGELKTPQFKFFVKDSSKVDTLKSEQLVLQVKSVMAQNMADINDIEKAIEFPDYRPLIVLGIVLIIGALGYLGFRILRRLRQNAGAPEPVLPPWVEALNAIEKIPWQEWMAKGLIKKYYYALSEILKRYIERRFEFNALDQTTTEINANLKLRKIPLREDFGQFFANADLVKYAKFAPPASEIETAITKLKELVNRTKPQEEPVERS